MSFDTLDLDSVLLRAVAEQGFVRPTTIQQQVIPAAMDGRDILASAPTGTGKTYLANALGEKACRQGYKVAYFTMQKVLDSIRIARLEGKDQKLMEKILKMDLLILDDFGMKTLEGQQQNDFQQILDDRYNRKAVIISSQLPVSDWHALFKNELIADACLDRIVHKSVRFQLKGESLRKKY